MMETVRNRNCCGWQWILCTEVESRVLVLRQRWVKFTILALAMVIWIESSTAVAGFSRLPPYLAI